MAFLIDASVLIEHERRGIDLEARVSGREDEEFMLSVVTVSELLHGVHRAREPRTRARRSAFVEGIIDRVPLLPVDLPTARAHSGIWADLARAGTPIGAHELWLAAAGIAHGLTIIMANVREFERVQGLEVERW